MKFTEPWQQNIARKTGLATSLGGFFIFGLVSALQGKLGWLAIVGTFAMIVNLAGLIARIHWQKQTVLTCATLILMSGLSVSQYGPRFGGLLAGTVGVCLVAGLIGRRAGYVSILILFLIQCGNAIGSLLQIIPAPTLALPGESATLAWIRAITGATVVTVVLATLISSVSQSLEKNLREARDAYLDLESEQAIATVREASLRTRNKLLDAISQGVVIADSSRQILYVNRAFEILTGHTARELRGQSCSVLQGPATDLATIEAMRRALNAGENFQCEIFNYRKDGTPFWNDLSITPIKSDTGEVLQFFGTQQDITARKISEERLRASQQQFQELIIDLSVGVLVQGPSAEILVSNKKALQLLDLTEDQLIGRTSFDPDWKVVHEDGSDFPGNTHPVPVAIATRTPVRDVIMGVYRPTRKDQVWLLVTAEPRLLENGSVDQVICTFNDITHQVVLSRERKVLVEELEAKNEELERFNYTVSHDLKSPLVTIRGFLGLLREDISQNNHAQIEDDLNRIESATQKMSTLLEDLLALSRMGRIANNPREVNMQKVVKDVLNLLSSQIEKRHVRVVVGDMPVVMADESRITAVWQNLIENAVKYMGDQKDPLVRMGCHQQQKQNVFFCEDNGIGIEPRFRETVFNQFSKIDPSSEGSGIGLAIARRVVTAHQGRMWIETPASGQGSIFCFSLPISKP